MKKSVTTFVSLFILISNVLGQIPTKCFEIESILADACGNPENGNEMVRFKVGANPLNTTTLSVVWPNPGTTWLGLIKNASTANTTAQFNSTITSCGFLKEPPATNLLPAGANVLLITSQAVSLTANSFANLTDTMYVIYQNLPSPSNNGHFANSSPTTRTLRMSFGSPASCSDTVTYLPNSLIGGDGARADFTWSGVVSYANDGCQAPIFSGNINITNVFNNGTSSTTICPGDVLNLTSTTTGSFNTLLWRTNGKGSFTSTSTANTSYNSSVNDTVPFQILVSIIRACNDTITSTVNINIQAPTSKGLSPQIYDLCPGTSVNLVASGGTSYTWTPNTFSGTTASVNTAGTYSVVISDGCYSQTLSSVVTSTGIINTSVSGNMNICAGQSTVIYGSSNANYLWSTGSSSDSIVVSTPGSYFLSAMNSCDQDTTFFTITSSGSPAITSVNGNTLICNGVPSLFTASGGSSYTWSDGSTGSSLNITTAGNYYVFENNTCGSDTTFFTVTSSVTPVINVSGNLSICTGTNTTLTASGSTSGYVWTGNVTGNTFTTSTPGNYFVTSTNACGTGSQQFTIVSTGTPPIALLQGNQFVCDSNATTTLTVSGGTSYLWSNNATGATQTFDNGANGYVIAINSCGQDTLPYTIIDGSVTASFFADTYTGYAPLVVSFENTSINDDAVFWTFGDGASSTNDVVVHTYEGPGSFPVVLIASNSLGCKDTTYGNVFVPDLPEVIIPNVFTPNSDGQNDLFTVSNPLLKQINGVIYNRWGNKIYETNTTTFKWDGRDMAGIEVSQGTYFYVLEIEYITGKKIDASGTVMMLK